MGLRYNVFTNNFDIVGSGGGSSLSLETDGAPNGDQTLLNLVSGTNITLTDNGSGSVTIDASEGGGGSPASPNTSIQFNDSGSFGGDADLTWDRTSNIISLNGDLKFPKDNIVTPHSIYTEYQTNADTSASDLNLYAGGGLGTGSGGALFLSSGPGGATDGYGGVITITSGNGQGVGLGGDLTFNAGSGGLTGDGGNFFMYGGAGANNGGGTEGNGGSLNLTGGTGYGVGKAGGSMVIVGGQSNADADAGSVILQGGYNNGGMGVVGVIKLRKSDYTLSAILDVSNIASTDKTFSFPNLTGTLVVSTPNQTLTDTSGESTSFSAGDGNGIGDGGTITLQAGNSTSGLAGNVILGAGTTTSGTPGSIIIPRDEFYGERYVKIQDSITSDTAGTRLVFTGAYGVGSGWGGDLRFKAGNSDEIAGTGRGGSVEFFAGNGGAISGNGGFVNIVGGNAPVDGDGGGFNLQGGNGAGAGTGGGFSLLAGQGGSTDGTGGVATLGGGSGGGTNGAGGNVLLNGGTGNGISNGGYISLTGGTPGDTGTGGSIFFNGGPGGAMSGDGGNIDFVAGIALGGDGWGGNVTIQTGAKNGAGQDGKLKLMSAPLGFYAIIDTASLMADQTFTFPNQSGTLALTTGQTYTISNVSTDRSYDANATTIDELADTLGTLIADLRSAGIVI